MANKVMNSLTSALLELTEPLTDLPPCPDNVHFIGIRHHSPRCATLVKEWIACQQPDVVLIEAPSDIQPMLAQLLLPHKLPIALFSYRQERHYSHQDNDAEYSEHNTENSIEGSLEDNLESITKDNLENSIEETLDNSEMDYHADVQTAQSWFPLLSFSPEWVAIQSAHAIGAGITFIDLPHWSYRAQHHYQPIANDAAVTHQHSDRYSEILARLLTLTGCDNQDALWERWFESADNDVAMQRLAYYFDVMRADEAGSEEDQCRERYMASWVDYHQTINPEAKILVICGGWHVNGIRQYLTSADSKSMTPKSASAIQPPDFTDYLNEGLSNNLNPNLNNNLNNASSEDSNKATTHIVAQGNYLIPIDYTAVERLTSYAAGMPSPQYYHWLYHSNMQAPIVFEKAMIAITEAIRAARQPLSTADLMVWSQASQSLARLRGLTSPYRQELLDGMLGSVINEALTLPPPWSSSQLSDAGLHSDDSRIEVQIRPLYTQDHPLLKLALKTLTGFKRGVLAQQTPTPPLLRQIERYLTALDIMPTIKLRTLTLSYRNNAERVQLYTLWQLHALGVSSVQCLGSKINFAFASNHSPAINQSSSKLPVASEHWQLLLNRQWEIELIEASRFGATLHEASKTALMEQLYHLHQLTDASQKISVISHVLTQVIQCGFDEMVAVLSAKLHDLLLYINDRIAISHLGKTLIALMQRGFYNQDIEQLLTEPFILVIQRLQWLLDGVTDGVNSGAASAKATNDYAAKQGDIQCIEVLKYAIQHADTFNLTNMLNASNINSRPKSIIDISAIMRLLYRLARASTASDYNIYNAPSNPTLRGAAFGAYASLSQQTKLNGYFFIKRHLAIPCISKHITTNLPVILNSQQWTLVPQQLPILSAIHTIKAIALMTELGDFLLGLFAVARHDFIQGRHLELLQCLHKVISESHNEAFLLGLPSLRQAFMWFSPNERYQIAKNLAQIMGLDAQQSADWQALIRQRLPATPSKVAKQIQQAMVLEQQTTLCIHNLLK